MANVGGSNVETPWSNFNPVFLGLLIVSGFLAIFSLLYFNRVFASVVSYVIRTYTWHAYRVYIDIQALQISLLAGRVFFTGLRYHGSNETILIQHGHVTWSYWLWRVKDADLEPPPTQLGGKGSSDAEGQAGSADKTANLPCRFNISVSGLEWFIYNRSPVYDSILSQMVDSSTAVGDNEPRSSDAAAGPMQLRQRLQRASRKAEEQLDKLDSRLSAEKRRSDLSNDQEKSSDGPQLHQSPSASFSTHGDATLSGEDDLPLMLQMLPIHFECDKAAVVMGNENTKSILIIKTKTLSGEIDATGCDTPDPYRQIIKIQFEKPVVEMKENEDYKEDQATRAARDRQTALNSGPVEHRSFFRRHRRKILGELRNMVPYWRKSVESFSASSRVGAAPVEIPGSNHWQGLSRYLNDDDKDDKIRWSSVEYAALTTLMDSPEAVLTIYWDVPGKVGQSPTVEGGGLGQRSHRINHGPPPAWAINLSVHGGVINYGPWADRHRAELQRVFNPSLSKDARPGEELPPGAYRVPTQFTFYLELDEEVTLRLPTREDSKNWRWRKEVAELKQHRKQERRRTNARNQEKAAVSGTKQRPYGWLDVKVGANATISYTMDMMAGPAGFSTNLKIELPSAEISTSVNHAVLLRSGALRVSCDLSTPLKWNALRNWQFDITTNETEIFLLRDHVFLLIDLIDDWASGPPNEYLTWVPFKYLLNMRFNDVKLYVNVNDANIINNPTEPDDNSYIVLSSPCLTADTSINLDAYRPDANAVPFKIHGETVRLELHVPPWNTQGTFLTSKEIGHLENFVLDGKYHYNSASSQAKTDTLVLGISGQSPTLTLHGFIIRYFILLKDNYFGEHVHFRTLDEYQEMLRLKTTDPEAEAAARPPHKKSNDLDVILNIKADDPKVLLATNLYSSKRHIVVEGPALTIELRFTSYYMDFGCSLSPVSLTLGGGDAGTLSATSSTEMFLDGLEIYGSRLFGIPPTEPTYLCNWDISVGALTGECTVEFLNALMGGGKAFGFTFDDEENALIPYSSIIAYDVTFLRVFVDSIQLWLHIEEAAFLLSTSTIDINYNDWARTHYSKRADIRVPDLQLSCVNSETAQRHNPKTPNQLEADALIRATIQFALIGRKPHFSHERRTQQELVRREDQRTHRAPFLIVPGVTNDPVAEHIDPPAQSVPLIPEPITDHGISEEHSASTRTSPHRLRSKNSFLSLDSSNRSLLQGKHLVKAPSENFSQSHSPGLVRNASDVQLSHNTVAFSSQYFPPYFQLGNIRPSTREAMLRAISEDDTDALPEINHFSLDDVDPELLNDEAAYQSFLIELPSGASAFFNAASLRYIAGLIEAFQSDDPEDILDNLQMSAVSDVMNHQKQKKAPGSIHDMVVRVPHVGVRFLNSAEPGSGALADGGIDQYDLDVGKIALATRSEALKPEKPRSSFHFRLDSAEATAAERSRGSDEAQAAVKATVESVMISMGTRDVKYIDADIRTLKAVSSSGRVEYLALLIERTNMLATELGAIFSRATERGGQCVRSFIYRLVMEGQNAGDPPFIVRPSAVLRAATEHLRTADSWKLSMRLRQMWFSLSDHQKESLRVHCAGEVLTCPDDTRERIIQAFQRWRHWELGDVASSAIMCQLFGKSSSTPEPTSKEPPIMAVGRLQSAELVLDPGPRQNQIFAEEVTIRFQARATPPEDMTSDGNEGPLSIVTVHCTQGGVNLNWDLLELVDDILRLEKGYKPAATKDIVSSTRSVRIDAVEASPPPVHVVFALGRGSILLESVNLWSDTQSTDLNISVLISRNGKGLAYSNAILACQTVTTKLRSHQQALGVFRLRGPSVFVSYEVQAEDRNSLHIIKATASSQDLKLLVRQDPIVLTEVLDTIVKDEVAQLYSLRQKLPQSPQPRPVKTTKAIGQLSSFKVNLALFLNTYTISLPVLRSLTYTISGVVARASMAANFGNEIIFDFDIKENSHDMQINVNQAPRSISVLQIPPTNGRITSLVNPGEHSITVFASTEMIQLDASAVYSLLAALNRPEMSNAINDVQQQLKIIQEHIEEIFGPSTPVKPNSPISSESQKLIYSIHTTMAGLEIFGNAPTNSTSEPVAQLLFCLDSIHLELQNRLETQGPMLENPEFRIDFRRIMFDIKKGTVDAMRSSGNLSFAAIITGTTQNSEDGSEQRFFDFKSGGFEVNLSNDTVSTFIDVVGYMGDKIKDLDTTREIEYLQKRLRQTRPRIAINDEEEAEDQSDIFDSFFSSIMYSLEICKIQISWLIAPEAEHLDGHEDLVLSFQRIEFATRKRNSARLTIENFQLQMVVPGQDRITRSLNSALLPEVVFNIAYVSTFDARRLAFQAVGKSLDLRLTSGVIVPAARLFDSIGLSAKNVQQASENWTPIIVSEKPATPSTPTRQRPVFGTKRLESLLIDADFAGAVIKLSGRRSSSDGNPSAAGWGSRPALAGKYGQFSADDSGNSMELRSPGLAWKTEYRDNGKDDPTLYGEVHVDASSNTLYPTVVPLIMDISSSIKQVIREHDKRSPTTPITPKAQESVFDEPKAASEENILTADPSAVLGRAKLNLGLRICKQEFTLSCQPIARVAATARFEDIYITVNTVHSTDHGNFFAISGIFTKLQFSVQHVYSRESTGSFNVDTIVLSLMNSKHVSGTSGVSAILKVSPMQVAANAKQLQDFLLFREIWYPREVRQGDSAPVTKAAPEAASQAHLVQRYQQVAATAAFPWTATLSISALDVSVDLGQSIGKSVFAIKDFWVSSKKTSDWEQNLCLGFQQIGIDCVGRLSGFISLRDFRLRTSIQWPERQQALNETPRIQASVGFSQFRLKAAFDYQAFLVADVTSMEFLMYNVRQSKDGHGDRLVAIFDGDAIQIFGTTTSAAQGVALWQAIQRLIQERMANYESSLRDIEKFMKRRSIGPPDSSQIPSPITSEPNSPVTKSPISLDTDVVVTLKAVNLGVFPSTFSDQQVFKLEALNAQARFAASLEHRRIHSVMGLTLGQLRIGLAGVRQPSAPKAVSEISVEDVVASATGSRGGTILKVPKVEAIMQTWQSPDSRVIDYIFKSAFEGKVEVGWNYSRISYIRGMWANHNKSLATTWGRELPNVTAIRVTGVPEPSTSADSATVLDEGAPASDGQGKDQKEQTKITAEVNVPLSKYEYNALEPPIIETPQLRDMGEATPPLEWIGLHRDRLPNLTHQIVIVSLLELAGEVEDAYSRILGSS